ncbi:DUF4280 domain-containing protein [Flavobacterium sp.]|uniref:DUF4280 domain-containing protein n=1 Tax=Flavobacterium sp. TaxID=239 RepID=UPI004047862F
MSEKHIIVHGATVQCKFSVAPETDVLQVLSQTKPFQYANDPEGSEKLVASTMDIGQTLQKNTFGNCKKQPNGSSYNPCQAVITEWKGFYDKVTLANKGKVLLEDSKATCPIGGPNCISITKHGQKAKPSQQNNRKKDEDTSNAINPMANVAQQKQESEQESNVEVE